METPHLLRFALLASAWLYATATEANPFGAFPLADPQRLLPFELTDARSYHHCHNLPRRTYCHTQRSLPSNWPPNTNTPGSVHLYRVKPHASTIGHSHAYRWHSDQSTY